MPARDKPMADYRIEGAARTVDLRDYLRVVWKRRWAIVATLIVTVVSAQIFTSLQVPAFQASATILIEPETPKIVNIQEVVGIGTLEDYYSTQYKLIQSRPIIESAIGRLQKNKRLPAFGDTDPYRVVASSLSVEPVKNTRLVLVKYEDPDPTLAADVANAIASEYVQYNLGLKQQVAKEAVTWLNEQLVSLRAQAQQSSKALQTYQAQADLLGLQEQRQITQQKMINLDRDYQTAQTQRMAAEAKLRELSRIARDPTADVLSIASDDPLIRKLKEEASNLLVERSKITQITKEKHPDVLQIDAQIKQVNQRLHAEIQKLVRALETDLKVARTREETLLASVADLRKEARKLNEREAQAMALQRDKDSNEELHGAVLKRLKEAGVTTALEASNARIVEAATPPPFPAKPRKSLIRVLSVIAGLGLGIGVAFLAESLDNKIRSSADVERAVGLPVLGIVPAFRVKRGG